MNRFRVLSAAMVLVMSCVIGLVSYVTVLNRPMEGEKPSDNISDDLLNSEKVKEISLPKRGTQQTVTPDPTYDFNGYVFRVLTSPSAKGRIGNSNILSEDLYGDVLNATAYTRNASVAAALNIEIREFVAADIGVDLKKSVLSNDDTFDLLSLKANSEMYLQLQSGALVDLFTVKTLKLGKPWYDRSAIRDLAIADKLFVLMGDIVAVNNDAVSVMVFNRDLARQFGYYDGRTYAFVGDAQAGRWTLDSLLAITEEINASIDSENATYGAFYKRGLESFSLSVGAGASSFCADPDGNPQISLNSEAFQTAFAKVLTLQTAPAASTEIDADAFSQGKTLFDTVELGDLKALKEGGISFGVLPMPKYDENQTSYRSLVSLNDAVCVAVPVTQPDLDRTGIIIEQLSAESSWFMWENYYDSMVDYDPGSVEMIQTALSSKVYDLGDLFGWVNVSQALSKLTLSGNLDDYAGQMTDRANAAQFVMNIILRNNAKNE